jgi:chorismate mutase
VEASDVASTCTDAPLGPGQQLDPAFAEKFLNFIIAEVIRHHERIAEDSLTSGGAPEA